MGQRNMRRTLDAGFKARVAIEAIRGDKTIAELSSVYEVHGNQVSQWKRDLLEAAPTVFQGKRKRRKQETDEGVLYEEIGRLKVELDWLKKKVASVR